MACGITHETTASAGHAVLVDVIKDPHLGGDTPDNNQYRGHAVLVDVQYCRILTWRGDTPDYSQYRGYAVLVDILQDPHLEG